MALEQKLPTRWALFELFISIWKLRISTATFAPTPQTMTYEYLYLVIMWGNKEIFRCRLYDTWRRIEARKQ